MKRIKWTQEMIKALRDNYDELTYKELSEIINRSFGVKTTANSTRKAYERYAIDLLPEKQHKPKILLFDIETLPMEAYVWSLWDQNVGLNMLKQDWTVLSFAAKWYGEDEIFYSDVRNQKNIRDDKKVIKELWKLLDEADITVGHNSDAFDVKKMNARFIQHGLQPPSSYKRMDTKKMAKKHFNFTSNKLAYLTDKLCVKYKKLSHGKFPGFSMWDQCKKGNIEAYNEMEEYNKYDVLSLEELFEKMLPWENASIFNLYNLEDDPMCSCGSKSFKKNGYYYTNSCKYQKYRCKSCGAEYRDTKNLVSKDKKKMGRVTR